MFADSNWAKDKIKQRKAFCLPPRHDTTHGRNYISPCFNMEIIKTQRDKSFLFGIDVACMSHLTSTRFSWGTNIEDNRRVSFASEHQPPLNCEHCLGGNQNASLDGCLSIFPTQSSSLERQSTIPQSAPAMTKHKKN
jgi:hypothetical protein